MTALLIDATVFITTATMILYLIVISFQCVAMFAECVENRRLPTRVTVSGLCQNLGILLIIIAFLFHVRELMVVGALFLALGFVVFNDSYRRHRVVDVSLVVTAMLSLGSLGVVMTVL